MILIHITRLNRTNPRSLASCGLTAAVIILLLPLAGCGYGEVSPTGYEYSKALYSITNRQAAEKLAEVGEQIELASQQGELGSSEAKWLRSILTTAEAGDWKAANRECRAIMEAQIKTP